MSGNNFTLVKKAPVISYGDAADDCLAKHLSMVVNQLADSPIGRQSEPRRTFLVASGQFVRGGYSLAEIPRPSDQAPYSATVGTPPVFDDGKGRGLIPSTPDRPPNS